MKIRDLTDKQIKKLQQRCTRELLLSKFKLGNKYSEYVELEAAWNQAWSNGLKAGLEFAGEVAESIVSK